MKIIKKYLLLIIALYLSSICVYSQRTEKNLNNNWKFILDNDNPEFSNIAVDDTDWTTLDIPHDWSFQKGVRNGGDQGQGGGYHDGGIGW